MSNFRFNAALPLFYCLCRVCLFFLSMQILHRFSYLCRECPIFPYLCKACSFSILRRPNPIFLLYAGHPHFSSYAGDPPPLFKLNGGFTQSPHISPTCWRVAGILALTGAWRPFLKRCRARYDFLLLKVDYPFSSPGAGLSIFQTMQSL